MKKLKRFFLSQYFVWLSIFLIVFFLSSVLLLDASHPLYIVSLIGGLIVFILQRNRKKLIKQEDEKRAEL